MVNGLTGNYKDRMVESIAEQVRAFEKKGSLAEQSENYFQWVIDPRSSSWIGWCDALTTLGAHPSTPRRPAAAFGSLTCW